jgi:2-amino-4-hydroxy-6-hydroxymethyldihydropteridine diphosphokinase
MSAAGPATAGTPALIGIGANLGDPRTTIAAAVAALAALPGTALLRSSSLYRTAPVGKTDQPDFFNAAALIQTTLAPRALLDALLAIELAQGRERSVQNAPRTLDLDLLLYGDCLIEEPGLVVPHPRMHERRFVLDPLVEITPYCIIPGRGAARECLEQSLDQRVERLA